MLDFKPATNEPAQAGFTLIELLLAMTVFSFMLLIIVVGFMNIVRMHNEAVASNQAQDSARTAMNELVLAVRDSGGVTIQQPTGAMCLESNSGQPKLYSVVSGALVRSDGCVSSTGTHQVTSSAVKVYDFKASIESGPTVTKPQVLLSLTVGPSTGSAVAGVGANTTCGSSQSDRTFCSVITLTSRAVQR